jgi:hypothetical protein
MAGLGLLAASVPVILLASGSATMPPERVVLHVLATAAPIATGLYAMRAPAA